MHLKIILRGVLSGFIAGVLAFAFARIFAVPVINRASDYESGRDTILAQLNKAAGRAVASDGPEIVSRSIQSSVGIATGLIGFSMAMGALCAVGYIVLQGRFNIMPRTLALLVPAFGFLGIFLVPFVKYPANPPAVGHTFTIVQRGHLYLAMVLSSCVLLGVASYVAHRMVPKLGVFRATVFAAIGFVVFISAVILALPSLGNLPANVQHANQFGFARASTETPQPITNLGGQIVYPGFDADVLWKFRWYELLNQLLIWTVLGLLFATFLDRMYRVKRVGAGPRLEEPSLIPG